ncbi:hypothetical protein [Flavobacterium sp.]|uniref:hypothetical protein n=1 Tax=Flavobacterium sp. TaxID=239 RepID=UPI0039E708C1
MKTEKILFGLFLVGILLKCLNLPGASILIILTLGILSILYFPFGFYFLSGKTFKEQKIGLSVVSGMFLSAPVYGILFALMRWPGSGIMLLIGIIPCVPLLVVQFLLRKNNPDASLDPYYRNLLFRTTVITAITALCFFLPEAPTVR